MGKFKDITGQSFGRLTALKVSKEKTSEGRIKWDCLCVCGNRIAVSSKCLRGGHTKSCGCLQKEQRIQNGKKNKHGMFGTPIYTRWALMMQRCYNPNDKGYKNYGGRGIKVCERWHSFENFYEDVGDPPKGMTLDRWPDNDGDYKLTNFRWATPKMQANNRRSISCGHRPQRWFYGHGPHGEMIIENNQSRTARVFGLIPVGISACLRGKRNHHHGWTFKWLPGQNIPTNNQR